MSWRYRIVREEHPTNPWVSATYSIREVYGPPINAWHAEPDAPVGESVEELRSVMEMMLLAFDQPVMAEEMNEDGTGKLIEEEEKP